MIKHIVFFKLKDRSEASIEETARILRSMDGRIELLKSLEIGVDVLKSERSFDISLTAVVDSLEALEAYQVHPVHQEIIKHMSVVKDSSVAVDYEI
ncbi:Dabb family protein [Paenibacillus urinalis]|uniref:Dabb family protein n=1 Tax=Paenibacillus urinalis TaxID=521520 RepID=A0AAX3N385_9BACL|nr:MULTISPECIES: Dabb family protein [Paenibacillus]WDH84306.1 Dabb family protein [Paenibacillus urinalis]WDH95775.1 Dabb family protein [Paenibacillus urinalis]WDI03989.1 Dabb family protein [Paenibacillus urinalis]GAK38703.1 stress responsive alpha-beta barrel domain-containing protein [Paenibacillus sp. TCA20]